MKNVVLIRNPLAPPSDWHFEDMDELSPFLMKELGPIFPATGRIYSESISSASDVTPTDRLGITKLEQLDGKIYVVIYPADPITIGVIIAVALAAVAIGLSFLLRPSLKTQSEQSPNNSLGERENTARPNERIPEIVGTVRSTPDLIAVPYRIFENYLEVEHSYMCIGEGDYTVRDCKDETTPIADINGAFAAVYAPFTSPNSGNTPKYTFGVLPSLPTKLVSLRQSNAVNGQILRAPNSGTFKANNNVRFVFGGIIETNDSSVDFNEYFTASTPAQTYLITLDSDAQASDPGAHIGSVFLNGTYIVLAVSANQITLSNSAIVNPNWNTINSFTGRVSTYNHTFTFSTTGDQWIGPVILQVSDMNEVWFNFVAQQGLYYIDSDGNQKSLTVQLQGGVTPVNLNGVAIGSEVFSTISMVGTAKTRETRGVTLKIVGLTPGFYSVRAKRITNIGIKRGNSYVEETQWRDLYAISPVTVTNFGNITTVQSITIPTPDSLSIKKRKLNLLVTRNLPTWVNRTASGLPQFASSGPTNNAADIICALALSPIVGRRSVKELDVAQIYGVADSNFNGGEHVSGSIQDYFNTPLMTEFCHTFDDSKVSFEESMAIITTAINCVAFRRGSTLQISFEKKTQNSTLLFNHRNKIPDSESRTVSFGTLNDNDGIEYTYIDPNAPNYPNVDTQVTLYFPQNQSAINPKKITVDGVRNFTQATLNGWRLYQKLLYQNTSTEFEATQEAGLAVLHDRILVADNTRSDTQDGEIVDVNGLIVTTSQDLVFKAGVTYTAFIQLYDETIQAIPVTAGTSPNRMILSTAPSLPLVYDKTMFARTTYILVGSDETRSVKVLPNQLLNGGFENNFSQTPYNTSLVLGAGSRITDNWVLNTLNASGQLLLIVERNVFGYVHSGNNALLMRVQGNSSIPPSTTISCVVLSDPLPVVAGSSIIFRVYIASFNNAPIPAGLTIIQRVGVQFYTSTFAFISESYVDSTNFGSNDYFLQTHSAVVPVGAVFAKIELCGFLQNTSGAVVYTSSSPSLMIADMRFDDAAITSITPTTISTATASAFLVAEKDPQADLTYKITAVNYSDHYYDHDLDFSSPILFSSIPGITPPPPPPIVPPTVPVSPGLPSSPSGIRPTSFMDNGATPTVNPANAYDSNTGTFAAIRSVSVLAPDAPVGEHLYDGSNDGQIKYVGIPASISMGKSLRVSCSSNMRLGTGVSGNAAVVAKIAGVYHTLYNVSISTSQNTFTIPIPDGTDISGISVTCSTSISGLDPNFNSSVFLYISDIVIS